MWDPVSFKYPTELMSPNEFTAQVEKTLKSISWSNCKVTLQDIDVTKGVNDILIEIQDIEDSCLHNLVDALDIPITVEYENDNEFTCYAHSRYKATGERLVTTVGGLCEYIHIPQLKEMLVNNTETPFKLYEDLKRLVEGREKQSEYPSFENQMEYFKRYQARKLITN